MTTLVVREATPDDLGDVLALMAQDARSPGTPVSSVASPRQRSALDELVADPAHQVLVGLVDGVVVATAHVTWLRVLSADGGLYCQVENVRTDEQHRGRGIGRELMAWIEAAARDRGAARLQLTTHHTRTDAHRFYERLGYEPSHVGMKKYLD
ncbi:MAG: GNAT family N-acetyltransferase [Aeromicrobium sp.]|uniref:GNAT family N-acetyltransferase n=1 Tax=Aeromicrobium sp. TaxID=1871063 RepID=UPI0025C6FA9C|nr:GNAT family N-acetyltransferase [Aeromicrobium sp.]MCK5892271.1 GNAT family N-acetyltransferase [Aeromicrobium sp.]MDF1705779.1 GNAT family N-acetyltransferase [Aeromicrobium sp.]